MLKKCLFVLLSLSLLLSTAASPAYFVEEVYLFPGETKTLYDLPIRSDDYESTVYIYLENDESLATHIVEAKSRMYLGGGDACTFSMELYAFDRDNHNTLVADEITHSGNSDWSETAVINVDVDAEYAIINFFFNFNTCALSTDAAMDIEVAVDREEKPVSIQFWADDTTIPRGQCTYLNWEVDNSQSVRLDGESVMPYDYAYVCPEVTTTYTMEVTAPDGSVYYETETIYVEDRPEAKVDFWADQYAIILGECTNLYWDITDNENNDAYLNNIPKSSPSGGETVCPTETTEYTLCAMGLDGNYTCESLIIEVIDARFWPEKESIRIGECSDIYWEIIGAAGNKAIFEGTEFSNFDSTTVCPEKNETYELCFTGSDNVDQCLHLTIEVEDDAPYLVVVTHSGNLNKQVGKTDAWDQVASWIDSRYSSASIIDLDEEGISATDFSAIDRAIENRIDEFNGNPDYILIIGGPAVVAYGERNNPMHGQSCRTNEKGVRSCDWDTLFTDNLYGDIDNDTRNIPEIPVARLPDGGDFEIYRIHFEQDFPKGTNYNTNYLGNYAIGQPYRPYAGVIGSIMNATSTKFTPPETPSSFKNKWGHWIYFILHGNANDTTKWWGEVRDDKGKTTYPDAWDISLSKHWDVAVSGACYGGYLGTASSPKSTTNSIALSFLRHGARAFMGYTITSYSPTGTEIINVCDGQICRAEPLEDVPWSVNEGDALLGAEVYRAMAEGKHPLDAFWQAKLSLANSLGPSFNAELKNLHGFHFYGLPPFNEISF